MNRKAVTEALEQIGVLLELLGENPFKTRAYGSAARTIRALSEDLDTLINSRDRQ